MVSSIGVPSMIDVLGIIVVFPVARAVAQDFRHKDDAADQPQQTESAKSAIMTGVSVTTPTTSPRT